jgi:hypothetical protein
MRKQVLFLSLLVAGATACAGRAPQTTLKTTYSCGGDRQVRHDSGRVYTATDAQLSSSWADGEGRHFVSWPIAATTMETTEYVIPSDNRQDAIERVYDTSKGTSRVDWRVKKETQCTANGGYSDALARFARGKSFDQVAQELSLTNKNEARDLVHQAMLSLQKRYYKDR